MSCLNPASTQARLTVGVCATTLSSSRLPTALSVTDTAVTATAMTSPNASTAKPRFRSDTFLALCRDRHNAKKIVGRKRGIITDILGLLLAVIVTAASASDNAIGADLLDQATTTYPTLTKTWADAGFKNRVVEHGAQLGVDVEIVTKDPQTKGFSVVKRRWVVERTLGWLMHHRRLVRDYEARPDNSASMITIAMIDNLAKRLTAETTPTWRYG
ncbi:transposase [Micromonospora sp. Llam0]|nr:transposase [Micromonospora sp. Llam0]